MNPDNPGILTTEFWGSFGTSVAALIPLLTSSSVPVQITCVICMTVAWSAYVLGRSYAKRG